MIDFIAEQYFECAASTAISRKAAGNAPHFSLRDIVELDGILQSCFDGLRLAGKTASQLVAAGLEQPEWTDVFVAGVLALYAGDKEQILQVSSAVRASSELRGGAISALGWVPWDTARQYVRRCVVLNDAFWQQAGLIAHEMTGYDPGECLAEWCTSGPPQIRARALQTVGVLARSSLYDAVLQQLHASSVSARACACWTAALRLQDDVAIRYLVELARNDSERAADTAPLLISLLSVKESVTLTRTVAQGTNQQVRQALILTGLLGIPDGIPWLIEMMAQPQYARVAGEAFYRITGLRLDQRPYEGDWPNGFEAGPNDDPDDDNVEMDEDENLPWPIQHEVAAWWEQNRTRFKANTRYLLGFELDNEAWLKKVLVLGRQRERATAALELAIRNPTEPLFNVEEHGRRQMKKLGVKRLPSEEYRCNHIEAGPDDTTWMKYLRDSSPFKT